MRLCIFLYYFEVTYFMLFFSLSSVLTLQKLLLSYLLTSIFKLGLYWHPNIYMDWENIKTSFLLISIGHLVASGQETRHPG